MLWEQDTFATDVLCEGLCGQQGHVLNQFRNTRPLLAAHLPEVAHSTHACPDLDLEDMSVDAWVPIDDFATMVDHYKITVAPKRLTKDLLTQITAFVYDYGKLYMLQFWYDLLGKYMDYRSWEPLYTDTYTICMASLHDCLCPEHCHKWFPREGGDAHKSEFVDIMACLGTHAWCLVWQCWEGHWLYDEKTAVLFKTE